jgi:hypothetical protein
LAESVVKTVLGDLEPVELVLQFADADVLQPRRVNLLLGLDAATQVLGDPALPHLFVGRKERLVDSIGGASC